MTAEYYVVMIEERYCLVEWEQDGECDAFGAAHCPHEKGTRWVPQKTIYYSIGPAHSTMNQIAEHAKGYPGWQTGRTEVFIMDPAKLTHYYNEAEQAAMRIGGLEAAKRMRKKRAV